MEIFEPRFIKHPSSAPISPSAFEPALPGSQAQKCLLNRAGAFGNLLPWKALERRPASYLSPSDRQHFPTGFLIPSPQEWGVMGRTKGCYLKLRSFGRGRRVWTPVEVGE